MGPHDDKKGMTMKLYDNDQILEAIFDMPSGYQREYAGYLYNRVADDAINYRDAVALIDFTTAQFIIDDMRHDLGRLMSAIDWEHDYDDVDLEHIFSSWVWDLMHDDD